MPENLDYESKIRCDLQEGFLVAFCDGSYSKENKIYSYGAVIIDENREEFEINGLGKEPQYASAHNVAGEIFGALSALEWARAHGRDKIKIYHDYEGVSKWIDGLWRANSAVALMYKSEVKLKYAPFIEIKFEKVKGHTHNKYNDKADKLARKALNKE